MRKNILKLVVSEMQRIESVKVKPTDEVIINIIKKLIISNEQTNAARFDEKLVQENEILSAFVPKTISKEEILKVLAGIALDENLGKATGQACRILKEKGLIFNSKDVNELINEQWSKIRK